VKRVSTNSAMEICEVPLSLLLPTSRMSNAAVSGFSFPLNDYVRPTTMDLDNYASPNQAHRTDRREDDVLKIAMNCEFRNESS